VEKAAEFASPAETDKPEPTPVDDYLNKAASDYPAHRVDIAQAIMDRALLINHEHRGDPEQVGMLKLARLTAASDNGLDPEQVANVIELYDKHYHLDRYYNRGLPSPEEVAWSPSTTKAAKQILRGQLVQMTNGSTYPRVSLEHAGLAPYRSLGDDFVNEVRDGLSGVDIEKVSAILPTLPLGDADTLDRALRATGVKTAEALCKESGLPNDLSEWTHAEWEQFTKLLAK
jgi:hypothetical protein